jgi:hypothetical protein
MCRREAGSLPATTKNTDLSELAKRIKQYHRAGKRQLNRSLEQWKLAGELLLEAKKVFGHGNFGQWVKSSVQISTGTAWFYMNIAKSWDRISSEISSAENLSWRQITRLIENKTTNNAQSHEAEVDDDLETETQPSEQAAAPIGTLPFKPLVEGQTGSASSQTDVPAKLLKIGEDLNANTPRPADEPTALTVSVKEADTPAETPVVRFKCTSTSAELQREIEYLRTGLRQLVRSIKNGGACRYGLTMKKDS